MKNDENFGQKRSYTPPKLIVYGDLATLTKGGAGSQPEVSTADLGDETKQMA